MQDLSCSFPSAPHVHCVHCQLSLYWTQYLTPTSLKFGSCFKGMQSICSWLQGRSIMAEECSIYDGQEIAQGNSAREKEARRPDMVPKIYTQATQ